MTQPSPAPVRIATVNVNGIRAATVRGFRTWLDAAGADIVAVQELRCPADLVPQEAVAGYHLAYDPGTLPGRNGVALLSRTPPVAVRTGLDGDAEFAHEGRWIEADYDLGRRRLTVASLYLTKGGVPRDEAGRLRHERKMRFCAAVGSHIATALSMAAAQGRDLLVMGDFNIAHTGRDLSPRRSKTPVEGFLPSEREWFTAVLALGLVDVVRSLRPDEQGPYSWWSWRGQSWNTDAGWRIDYHLATAGLAATAVAAWTDKAPSYEARMSDHAPVLVDYA